MTGKEHEEMVDAGNRFWEEFSALCDRYISAAPEHLRDQYTMYLGEKTSIYGRKTDYIARYEGRSVR